MKRALFISGGWDGHKPEEFTARYVSELAPHGFDCQCETDLRASQPSISQTTI